MLASLLSSESRVCMVPESVRQLGDYELDLMRLYYFGWINAMSLGMNLLQQQLVQEGD